MSSEIEKEVMNIREAAAYLQLSPDTVYKYAAEKRIPAFKFGNRWRFKRSELDAWMVHESWTKVKLESDRPGFAQFSAVKRV